MYKKLYAYKHFLIILTALLLVSCAKPKDGTKQVVFIYDKPINGWNVQIDYVEDTTRTEFVSPNALSRGYAHVRLSKEQQTHIFTTPFDIASALYVDSKFDALSHDKKIKQLFAQDTIILSYIAVNYNDSMLLTHELPLSEPYNLIYFADINFDGTDDILLPHQGGQWLLLEDIYYLYHITETEILPFERDSLGDLFYDNGTRMYFYPQDTTIITSYRGENFGMYKGDGKGNFYLKRALADTRYDETICIEDYDITGRVIDSCRTANPWMWYGSSDDSLCYGNITLEEMIYCPFDTLKNRCDTIQKHRDY